MLGELGNEPPESLAGDNAGLQSVTDMNTVLPDSASLLPNVATTDPMQGLSVMAIVAAKAEPQLMCPVGGAKDQQPVEEAAILPSVLVPGEEAEARPPDKTAAELPPVLVPATSPPPVVAVLNELVETDIEVVVPLKKTIHTTTSLAAMYEFKGTAELGGKLTTAQKRGIIRLYLGGLESGHMEQKLKPFCNWFEELRFVDAILKPEEGDKVWQFTHALLCPGCLTKTSFGSAPEKYYKCLEAFYQGVFVATPSMDQQIARAVADDISILILAMPVDKKITVGKSLSPYSTSLITVSAVSFQMHRDPNDAGMVSVFLSLLGVTHHASPHPPSIRSWRRNGMGLFMLIEVIKRCASIKGVTKIEIFLQCSEPSAFHFYSMVGFRQKNKSETDDGFGMLPEHLQIGLETKTPTAFLRFNVGDTKKTTSTPLKAPILMHLPHGGLKHLTKPKPAKETKDGGSATDVTLKGYPLWCQYPPQRLLGGGRLMYEQKDANNLFTSLPLLRKLFPLPLEPLLPADSLHLTGEMLLSHRIKHTEMQGFEWFETGEIDLMLSILLCDGRYEDAAFILPVKFSTTLKIGCRAHEQYKAMLQLEKDNASMDEKEREALIKQLLGKESNEIRDFQERQQNIVLNEIIDRYPGLLSKKVLVFPQNETGDHWSVVFVFNPGYIREHVDDGEELQHPLQPCFFRYCSLEPYGDRNVGQSTGILWFLNLYYSNTIYEESRHDPNAAMKWCSPFGKAFTGYMLGTRRFPALRLPVLEALPPKQGVDLPPEGRFLLPKQVDGCNCGTGIIAAIAIMLRNICNEKKNQMSFNDQFGDPAKLELQEDEKTKETFIVFDARFFEPLPT